MNETLQLLVFSLEGRLYGVRINQVQRVIRAVDVTPLPLAPSLVTGIIDLQGEIVPVLNIRKRFNLVEKQIGVDDQFIVATTSRRAVVIVVDRVAEVIERPANHLLPAEKFVKEMDQIEGVIQLDDGLTLIHDLERFLSLHEERELEQAMKMEAVHAE